MFRRSRGLDNENVAFLVFSQAAFASACSLATVSTSKCATLLLSLPTTSINNTTTPTTTKKPAGTFSINAPVTGKNMRSPVTRLANIRCFEIFKICFMALTLDDNQSILQLVSSCYHALVKRKKRTIEANSASFHYAAHRSLVQKASMDHP